MALRRTETRLFNKLHGAAVINRTLMAMNAGKTPRKPLLRGLFPFKSLRASGIKELEEGIKVASCGRRHQRILIRGDVIPLGDFSNWSKAAYWGPAPRGHLDMKTGTIEWDRKPEKESMTKYRFLLYATKPKGQIEKEGSISISKDLQDFRGSVSFGKRIVELNGTEVKGLGALNKPLSDFVTNFTNYTRNTDYVLATIHFIKWKGEKGIEFYDCLFM